MAILLDDITGSGRLFPFGQLQSIAFIRVGMFTLFERWEKTGHRIFLKSQNDFEDEIIDAVFDISFIPSFEAINKIRNGDFNINLQQKITNTSDLFKLNDWALRQDFQLLTHGEKSRAIPNGVQAIHPENIFIEEGAEISFCIINAGTGPVYISRNATIMEGVLLRGPVFCGEGSVLKMGAKIYGGTSIGPGCVAGGEIKNSIMMECSNKAHDGYLGDSVLGPWCNLGAGTSNSNLKNNASSVSIRTAKNATPMIVGIKCGLLMGDYSRAAINTSFNTGSVVGVCSNIFGQAMPEKFTGNFTWGRERYQLEKALTDIDNWKKLKGSSITEEEKTVLKNLYNRS